MARMSGRQYVGLLLLNLAALAGVHFYHSGNATEKADECHLADNVLEHRATLWHVQQLFDREARGCGQARERTATSFVRDFHRRDG